VSFFKNYLLSLLTQFANIITPFVTLPIVATALGKAGMGKIAVVNSILQYFFIFGSTGLMAYGNKVVARSANDQLARVQSFYQIATMQAFLSIISMLLFSVYILVYGVGLEMLFWAAMIQVAASVFDIAWFFYGINNFKVPALRNFLLKVSGIVLIFIFVSKPEHAARYLLIIGVTSLVSNISVLAYLYKYLPRSISNFNFNFRKHLIPALSLLFPLLIMTAYSNFDRLILSKYDPTFKGVGTYDIAMKIIMIFAVLVISLRPLMISRVSSVLNESGAIGKIEELVQKSLLLVIYVSMPVCILLYGNSNTFIQLYLGHSFSDTSIIIKILAAQIFFTGVGDVFVNQILIGMGKEKQVLIIMVVLSIILLGSYLIFIPFYGVIGAAVSSVLAHLLILVLELFFVRKYLKFNIPSSEVGKMMIASVGLISFLLFAYRIVIVQSFVMLSCVTIGGLIVYAAMLYFLKFKLQNQLLALIRNMIVK
jgi:O-antigen/teichoic acid export membrane protein